MSPSAAENATHTSREATKRETRQALIDAALAEFSGRGFDAPSLDAICARAGYTRGAFYVHFRDREDLVAGVMEYAIGAVLDAVIAHGGQGDDLRTTIERFALVATRGRTNLGEIAEGSVLEAGPPFHQLLAGAARTQRVRDHLVTLLGQAETRVAEAVETGQKAGRVRKDVAPEDASSILLLLALGILAAADVRLPLDVAKVGTAALQLFASPAPTGSAE